MADETEQGPGAELPPEGEDAAVPAADGDTPPAFGEHEDAGASHGAQETHAPDGGDHPHSSSVDQDTALFWLEDEEVPELDFRHPGEEEKPLGTRRATPRTPGKRGERSGRGRGGRSRRTGRGRAGADGPRNGRAAVGDRPGRRRPASRKPVSARRIWIRRIVAMFSVVIAAVFVWFALELYQPFHGSGHGSVEVTIPKGSSTSDIGSLLAHDGVVSSGFFFKLRADIEGKKLLAGKHKMKLGMSYAAALKVLSTPPPPVPTTNVTITPGRSRKQIDKLLKKQGVKGSYVKATRHSRLLKPTAYGAPKNTPSLEGFLFPDTYQLRKPVKMSALVADQLKRFKQEFKKVNFRYAKSKNLSPYDVLIIASLIEGEAQKPGDLRLVASVIYNRLRDGIDLGLDSTVEYATGNYGTLTASDLNSSSPYNTRNHPGLTPTPINSPGLQAIRAAAHPKSTNDLYFINKVCGGGKLLFTASYSQFLAWSQQWSAAVAKAQKNGGSAEFCKKNKS